MCKLISLLLRSSIAFLLILCTNLSYGQNEVKNTLSVERDVSTAFDKTIGFFLANDHFIVSVDKNAGFVQSRVFVEHKKMITIKEGERITFNVVIRANGEKESILLLQIYIEEKLFGGSINNRTYYYKDKGVSKDNSLYSSILKDLRRHLEI